MTDQQQEKAITEAFEEVKNMTDEQVESFNTFSSPPEDWVDKRKLSGELKREDELVPEYTATGRELRITERFRKIFIPVEASMWLKEIRMFVDEEVKLALLSHEQKIAEKEYKRGWGDGYYNALTNKK